MGGVIGSELFYNLQRITPIMALTDFIHKKHKIIL